MLLTIFVLISAVGSALLTWLCGWYESLHVIWQAPLVFIGLFLALTLLFGLLILISSALVNLEKEQTRRSGYFSFLLRYYTPVAFLLMGVRLQVRGREKVPTEGNFLLVCNHLSIFDPVVLFSAVPRQVKLSFITKQENFEMPVVRKFMHKLLCLPLNRENDRQALRTIIRAAQLLKEQPLSMTIFPEGQTSKTGHLLPFRNGAFKIAQRANCPIVVATLQNTRAIPGNMFRRPTHVQVDFLDTIPVEELAGHTTVEIGERVHTMMETVLNQES